MNVTFRMQSKEQEQAFIAHCDGKNIMGLKGHRSVGGLRASLYNAVPMESVEALCRELTAFRG